MPIFESYCDQCRKVKEWFTHRYTEEDPACENCGGPTMRLASTFRVIWSGVITARYNDPKRDNAHQEGHWAYRTRSSRSGNPEPVFIETFDDQRRFCRDEGLVNPKDVSSSTERSER